MHQKLPKEIDPFRFAQNGLELEGELPVASMKRLAGSLHDADGRVSVFMHFDVDETQTPYMRGKFHAVLTLICERCMEPMTVDIDVDCLLALVKSERKIEGLAEQYDPWIIDNDDPVTLSNVVEDELILALPLVPKHKHDCLPADVWHASDETNVEEKRESPFAVLSSLKTKN